MQINERTNSFKPPLTASFVRDCATKGTYPHGEYGLYLRVRSATSKTYVVIAKPRNSRKSVTATIGSFKAVTLTEAKEHAKRYYTEIRDGVNPAEERRAKRAAEEASKKKESALHSLRLGTALNLYKETATTKANTKVYYEVEIRKHLVDWLETPLPDIKEEEILKRHQDLKEKRSVGVATLTMRALSSLFTFCMLHPDTKEHVNKNPVRVLADLKQYGRPAVRHTMLPTRRIADWANVVDKQDSDLRDFLWLLLLTGLRKNTLAHLHWEHFDFEEGVLNIPHELDKGKRDWSLPLGEEAVRILKDRWHHRNSDSHTAIFPGRRSLSYFNCRPELYKPVADACGIKSTPHSLRRTFLTHAGNICPGMVAQRLIGHNAASNVAMFNYYRPENSDLRGWVQRVEDSILNAANVPKEQEPPGVVSVS